MCGNVGRLGAQQQVARLLPRRRAAVPRRQLCRRCRPAHAAHPSPRRPRRGGRRAQNPAATGHLRTNPPSRQLRHQLQPGVRRPGRGRRRVPHRRAGAGSVGAWAGAATGGRARSLARSRLGSCSPVQPALGPAGQRPGVPRHAPPPPPLPSPITSQHPRLLAHTSSPGRSRPALARAQPLWLRERRRQPAAHTSCPKPDQEAQQLQPGGPVPAGQGQGGRAGEANGGQVLWRRRGMGPRQAGAAGRH